MFKRTSWLRWPTFPRGWRTVVPVVTLALGLALGAVRVAASEDKPADKTPTGMVFVPAGEFLMGTNEQDKNGDHTIREYSDAYPQHKVDVAPFYIDKTEVTNTQYHNYCAATHYPPPPHWKNGTSLPG